MVSGPAVLAAAGSGGWRAVLADLPGLSLSGEAVVAGLLSAVVHDWTWPDTLRHAVALGAAADPAGEVDLDGYDLLAAEVAVQPAG
jgi:fructose-1-phosphate kinase PfkB-like protein